MLGEVWSVESAMGDGSRCCNFLPVACVGPDRMRKAEARKIKIFPRGLHSLRQEISGDLSRFLKKSLTTPTVGAESRPNFRGRRVLGHLLPSRICMTRSSSDMTRSQGGLQVPFAGAIVGPKKIDQGNVANAVGVGPNPSHSRSFLENPPS